ncbi:MAG: NifU family protein [Candidatus Neptunochlamydia sp.]|nr:NifU family protein [Candidatus Neptunochlamydia sp.]
MKPYPWTEYSNLLKERILSPRNVGSFKENTGAFQEMRVVTAKGERDGSLLIFSIIVDETDGIIADAKFMAFGETVLVGASDAACEVLLRKNYNQARRLTADLIDRKLRDFTNIPAFPKTADADLNFVLSVIEEAAEKCTDIPLKDPSITPPVPAGRQSEGGHPNWHLFSPDEKLDHIKEVIRDEIQPYIELDAGGIEVAAFNNEKEVIITYQGACTTCPSSTGATLESIQQILRLHLSPSLDVKPDLYSLQS